jgi:hypothetical protein
MESDMERGNDRNAAFYNELREMAARLNQMAGHLDQESDLLVIGGDAEEGEFSVDLLDGLEPRLVADALKAVAVHAAGGNTDCWIDSTIKDAHHCAVIALAFERTLEGCDWKNRHGERPYSLAFIYTLAMDNGPLIETVLKAIKEEAGTDLKRIHQYATEEFFDAMTYFSCDRLLMPAPTRDGIKVNLTKILGPFASNVDLRRRFASGNGAKVANDPQLWGKLACVNFSTIEFGIAGRLLNVFLKTLLMTAAIHREKASKANPRTIN